MASGDHQPGSLRVRATAKARGLDDACHLSQCPPSKSLAAHGKSEALGVSQPKRLTAELLSEDPIFLSQIVDQILLVAVQPPSQGGDEELQSIGHHPRLRRADTARTGPYLDDSAASAAFSHHTGRARKRPGRSGSSAKPSQSRMFMGLRSDLVDVVERILDFKLINGAESCFCAQLADLRWR